MAERVYSVRMLARTVSSSATASAAGFAVPVGKIAVVRSVVAYTDVAGDAIFGMLAPNWSGILTTTGLAARQTRVFEGRVVFTAGETMGVTWLGGTHSFLVSGYLLTA